LAAECVPSRSTRAISPITRSGAATSGRRIAWLFLLSLAVLCGAHAARADDFMGGDGGGAFAPINCPRGKVIRGLAGRTGAVIDTIQLFCGKGTGSVEDDILDPRRIGPSNGGGPVSVLCPIFEAVVGIQVNVREHEGSIVVSQIVLQCQTTLEGANGARPVFGFGGGDDAGSQTCPANHYAAGFAGRAGTFVDAVGITTCRHRSTLNRP